MTKLNPVVARVTERIRERSKADRGAYLDRVAAAAATGPARAHASCANLAHAFAGADGADHQPLRAMRWPTVGIVSAYNDMLSAHKPYESYPGLIKSALRDVRAVGQMAGGVPAMCDGVTQGRTGMELSLYSRDVIAMATAVALAHETFDGALMLGVCDKIVPGLLMGALSFGHLPVVMVPAGPMPSGLPNDEKARIRQQHAQGLVSREALLDAECAAYHGPGTCTFYGTANTNQFLMEIMGLHLPGAAFVNPSTELREALTRRAAQRVAEITHLGNEYIPVGHVVDERCIVNAVVGLHATGGSTNHTLHLVAMARAAGVRIHWDDFSELSEVVPLLARVYPNGPADVNHFHAAGGTGFVIGQLLDGGLVHADVQTVMGPGLDAYRSEPFFDVAASSPDARLHWRRSPQTSLDDSVLRTVAAPFSVNGGLKVLDGNLGRAVIKVSAVKLEHQIISAPARVFRTQEAFAAAFDAGQLEDHFVAVLTHQGPRANGMPELHRLTPLLGVLQDRGLRVALVTDGRMSGASGKVPAAIHVSPEAAVGGPLARIKDGDIITLDVANGSLEVNVSADELAARPTAEVDLLPNTVGFGRELFAALRAQVSSAEEGAITF